MVVAAGIAQSDPPAYARERLLKGSGAGGLTVSMLNVVRTAPPPRWSRFQAESAADTSLSRSLQLSARCEGQPMLSG
jgi:hypothetical protein